MAPGLVGTAPAAPEPRFRVAQFNAYNAFDTVPPGDDVTPEAYERKLAKISLALRDAVQGADLIAVQEVENLRVLSDIAARPELKEFGYKPVLVPSNDARGINVGLLYRADRITIDKVDAPNPVKTLGDGIGGQVDPNLLFARAPLVIDMSYSGPAAAAQGAQNLTVIVNHFKSKSGGPKYDARRNVQASFVGSLVDARHAANPKAAVMVVGDLNTYEDEKTYEIITTTREGAQRLHDPLKVLPDADRYTYIYGKKYGRLDYLLTSPGLSQAVTGAQILHINTGKDNQQFKNDPSSFRGVSDHDIVLADFDFRTLT